MAHTHDVFDTDQYFSVDENTRTITFQGDGVPVIAQGDRNSERFTFELPRYIDGHDMTQCNVAQVHFVNINASDQTQRVSDIYDMTDLQVDIENDELALCTWLIGPNATKYVGSLNFALRFACVNGDVIEYSWSTVPYTKILIASTIDNTDDAASNLNYTLDVDNPIVELEGYYSGTVQIDLESVTVTPSSSTQIVRPSAGKVLEYVIVNPASGSSGGSTPQYKLSGPWSFNISKLQDTLVYIPGKIVSANISYRHGDPNSENDSYTCYSMTFDFAAQVLKFDDVIVFYGEPGIWTDPPNGDYGTSVTFDSVQYVSEEFHDLFISATDPLSSATAAVLQDNKDYEVTATDDITITIGPDSGFDAMKQVTVRIKVPNNGGSGSGSEATMTDDGEGNVTLYSGDGSVATLIDDGEGNITIGE